MTALSRRRFLAAGGALVVTFRLGAAVARSPSAPDLPRALATHPTVDSWLRIGADDTVTVFTGKAELGQGLTTALVQIAAEELDVRAGAVEVITADTGRSPNEAYTAGSRSITDSGMSIRHAAAKARQILLELAAVHLNAPPDTLQVRDGVITAANGESVRFGALVNGRTLDHAVDGEAPLKPRGEYRLVGLSLPRVDLPAKVYGGAAFIQDLRLNDMLHARVVHPPNQRARLLRVDTAASEDMLGVHAVMRDGSLLGVIAEREEQAVAAAARLRADTRWSDDVPEFPDEDVLEEHMRGLQARHSVLAERGERTNGERRISASYLRPFQAHASIGPSCALAVMRDDRLTVWTHSQGVHPLREEMTRVLPLKADAIHVIHMENAGCYGQNGADDAAIEAALLARAVPGRPVRLQWSREDEFTWEPLGAAMLMDCDAALDADGRVADWRFVVRGFPNTARPNFGAGNGANLLAAQLMENALPPREATNVGLSRNAVPLYDFPAVRIEEDFLPQSPVRVSSLRSLGAYANVFATESFMDELALAAGTDPVAFRLAHLGNERARAVIQAAARAANWERRQELPDGRALGIAFSQYSNYSTYCAVVADVAVTGSGAVRVHRLWAACDCGQIVNPDGVRNQIAGGAIQSASWTLKEAVRFGDRGNTGRNWQDYPILTFAETPEVEVVLLDRPDAPPVGAGEASQGPTAAAIANAVHAASGARVRQIPLTPQRVTAARG